MFPAFLVEKHHVLLLGFPPRSDACVVAGRPLVSAAAVGTDGQLTVYNYGQDGKLVLE